MESEIEFRILSADDLNSYREIRLDCLQNYPDNFGTLFENEINSKSLKFDKVLREENSKSFLLGAFIEKELIGICGFTREDRLKTNHRGEINQMYVLNKLAGQGIGTKLLKLTLDKAFTDESLELIELGVVNNNDKAIKIYSNFGFVEFGHLEKYFKYENKYWAFKFMVLTKDTYLNGK